MNWAVRVALLSKRDDVNSNKFRETQVTIRFITQGTFEPTES